MWLWDLTPLNEISGELNRHENDILQRIETYPETTRDGVHWAVRFLPVEFVFTVFLSEKKFAETSCGRIQEISTALKTWLTIDPRRGLWPGELVNLSGRIYKTSGPNNYDESE